VDRVNKQPYKFMMVRDGENGLEPETMDSRPRTIHVAIVVAALRTVEVV
jgi:hypothetical protein